MLDLGSNLRVQIHVQAAFSKSNWTVLQYKLDLYFWSLCACQEADDPGGREASSSVSPAEGLSPRAYSLSCSPTQLLCWAPVSSAPRAQPCVAVLFSPFLTHRRYDFVKSPRRGKQELWELAAGLPSGHIHSDFWAAQGEEVQAPPVGSSLSGPHWGLISTEDLVSSLRGTSKEGWKGKWKSRS